MSTSIPAVTGTTSIKHGLLIDLTINATTYYLSNLYTKITWNGNEYTQLGNFISMTEIQDDIRITNNQLTVVLNGLPPDDGSPNYMNVVLNSNIKGSKIIIRRAFFNVVDNSLIAGEVYTRFNGYVSNFGLSENWDQTNKLVSNTISLQCASIHGIIEKQYSGRRTNEKDQQLYYPADSGMYRVKIIADSNFDFGKPYTAPAGTQATNKTVTPPPVFDSNDR